MGKKGQEATERSGAANQGQGKIHWLKPVSSRHVGDEKKGNSQASKWQSNGLSQSESKIDHGQTEV